MDSRDSQTRSTSQQETPEKSYNHLAGSDMDTDTVSCHMASTFYDILRESGLQRQLEHGWGHTYSYGDAADSASSPTSDFGESHQSDQSPSRQIPKRSSPSASRKQAQRRDVKRLKSPKPKKSRGSEIKEEEQEEDMEEIQTMPEPGEPYSLKRDSQTAAPSTSGYKSNREDYADREYLGGLDSELDALRKHLLQRANPPRSFP